jgi:hypothetical protein
LELPLALTLWFNHNFSSLYNVIGLIREGMEAYGSLSGIRVLVSHSNPEFLARPLADLFFQEPARGYSQESYLDFCLETCRERGVDIFWPSREASFLEGHRNDFEALGVRLLICASARNLDLINDKALFYEEIAPLGLSLPAYFAVDSLSRFDKAVEEISKSGAKVCFKPAKSIYGLGFKIISEKSDPLRAFLNNSQTYVSLEEARSRLDVPPSSFPRLLVMEYLPGLEYSLDCLALKGELIRASVRQKSAISGAETLISGETLEEKARILADRFDISGLFNLQLREDGKQEAKILELNPRMAGGIYFSALAGLNYPYWALRLSLEDCRPLIPHPSYGLVVNQAYRPFVYASLPTLPKKAEINDRQR